jgi:hypothetical protein
MKEIRTTEPLAITTVTSTKQFVFYRVGLGNYTIVILATSYNGSVGSPLPYEFACPSVTLAIAFQGGDYKYAVGAFSVINTSSLSKSMCTKNPYLCQVQQGSLYQECPFE